MINHREFRILDIDRVDLILSSTTYNRYGVIAKLTMQKREFKVEIDRLKRAIEDYKAFLGDEIKDLALEVVNEQYDEDQLYELPGQEVNNNRGDW